MLRELTLPELEVVSGGTDQSTVISTGTRNRDGWISISTEEARRLFGDNGIIAGGDQFGFGGSGGGGGDPAQISSYIDTTPTTETSVEPTDDHSHFNIMPSRNPVVALGRALGGLIGHCTCQDSVHNGGEGHSYETP